MQTVEELISSRDSTCTTISGLFLAFLIGVTAGAPSHEMKIMICDGISAVFLGVSIPLLLRHIVRTRIRRQQYDFAFLGLLAEHNKKVADLQDDLSRGAMEEAAKELKMPGITGLTSDNLGTVAGVAMKKMKPALEKLSQQFQKSVEAISHQYLVARLPEQWSRSNFMLDVLARKLRYWFFSFGVLFFVISILFRTGLITVIVHLGKGTA